MNRRKPILIADDDPDDRYLITLAFRDLVMPDKLQTVEHGQKLLDYLDSVPDDVELPGLIVLDINMPVLDGISTLAKIKSIDRYKNIPVVMLSTSDSDEDKAKATGLGAVDYIVKPYSYRDTKIVAQLLQNFVGEY